MEVLAAELSAETGSLFLAANSALNSLRRAQTEQITLNVDSWVGIENLAGAANLDIETASLAKAFLDARAAFRKHQSDKYRAIHDKAAAASDAYVQGILGVHLPARVTLSVHGVPGTEVTDTIASISFMAQHDGVVSGSFNTTSPDGKSHSTRGFRVDGQKVSFLDDIDF